MLLLRPLLLLLQLPDPLQLRGALLQRLLQQGLFASTAQCAGQLL